MKFIKAAKDLKVSSNDFIINLRNIYLNRIKLFSELLAASIVLLSMICGGLVMFSEGPLIVIIVCMIIFAISQYISYLIYKNIIFNKAGITIDYPGKNKKGNKKTRKTYVGLIQNLKPNQIFVFGSNPEGKHGAGAARQAYKKFGAHYGEGRGLTGQCYALPTKNLTAGYYEKELDVVYARAGAKSIPRDMIVDNICVMYGVAELNPDKEFLVAYTAEGKLLNGYTPLEMAWMFFRAGKLYGKIPDNVVFEEDFYEMVINNKNI